jgi:hypothetical protein
VNNRTTRTRPEKPTIKRRPPRTRPPQGSGHHTLSLNTHRTNSMATLSSFGYQDPLLIVQSCFGIALYAYDSPESTHLSFKKGKIIKVESINSGWLYCHIDGIRGWVPGTFVSDIVTVDDSSSESQIILEIREQSIKTARILEEELERQRVVVTECAEILDLCGNRDAGSRSRLRLPRKEQVSSGNATSE